VPVWKLQTGTADFMKCSAATRQGRDVLGALPKTLDTCHCRGYDFPREHAVLTSDFNLPAHAAAQSPPPGCEPQPPISQTAR
jgi:hypothetical protein